jgi:hypothetical protein
MIMKIEIINNMRVQIADTGKALINNDTFSQRVYLGDGAASWQEVDAPADLWDNESLYTLVNGVFELNGEVLDE